MADVMWQPRQRRRAQVDRLTVTTANTGGTITATLGAKDVVVTPSTTNTTTTAAEIAAACEASTEPEFEEITWTSATNVVTATGPDDGTPFFLSKADAGGNSTSLVTATAALSPNHLDDPVNFSAGLPGGGDRVVFQDGDVSALHRLDVFDGVDVDLLRRPTFTGGIGLPDENPAGYREYRGRFLMTAGEVVEFQLAGRDTAGQFRVECNGASPVALRVAGDGVGGVAVGEEVVEVTGLPTGSTVDVVGGSAAIAPSVGQVAEVGTLRASNAAVRIGPGVTLTAGQRLYNVALHVEASWSGTLTIDGEGASVTVGGAAAGSFTLDGGVLTWRSSGNPGNSPTVGSGARLDLTQAPTTLSIGGTVQAYAGCVIDDSAGRGGNLAVKTVRCTLAEITWLTANDKTYTQS